MKIDTPLRSQHQALRSLWQEAFSDTDEFLNDFECTAFSSNRCRCVTEKGKIAAALYWFDCLHMGRSVAYLYAVATAKEFQGQGICHKMIEDTHLHLKKSGYQGTILVPGSKELFRFYESMGYHTCSQIREIPCTASPNAIELVPIDKTEYAILRRQFLPKGGVIQENENLDFLQTQVKFYMGPGFLLAARRDANVLYGMELLGDEKTAPQIVHTFGYEKGIFRMPGDGRPFAMYHSLDNSKHSPITYFGLAFD